MDSLAKIFEQQKKLQNDIYASRDLRDREGNQLTIQKVMQEAQDGKWGADHLPNRQMLLFCRAIQDELHELEDLLPWKNWSRAKVGEKEYPDQPQGERSVQAALEVVDILHFVVNMWLSLGLDYEDLLTVYECKREVNERRQESGYNEAHKTNDDNDELCKMLANALYPKHIDWDET